MEYSPYANEVVDIAKEAGDVIMTIYQQGFEVQTKEDGSPVTQADLAANAIIVEALEKLTPNIPIVAEESALADDSYDYASKLFWLVDPLDGTKSFIQREGEFTVNIALINKGQPVGGVVVVPVHNIVYFVGDDGQAYQQNRDEKPFMICTRKPGKKLVVMRSRSHGASKTNDYIEEHLQVDTIKHLSGSWKFCIVAAGEADCYPRLGRTMEWDTAAGHAVLNAAGGVMETIDGKPFYYGKPGFENDFFIARGMNEIS